jgi:hypothetical protein
MLILLLKKEQLVKYWGLKIQINKGGNRKSSDFPAEIIKVNALCIDCSIAEGSYLNGRPVHILYQFFPDVAPGFKIIESPKNIIYFPVTVKIVDKVTVKILDQNLDLVNFRKETVTVRLHIKKID